MKKRIVIIDGCTTIGVSLAEAVRHSPATFGLAGLPIVLVERPDQAATALLTQEKEQMLATLQVLGLGGGEDSTRNSSGGAEGVRHETSGSAYHHQEGVGAVAPIVLETVPSDGGWNNNRLPLFQADLTGGDLYLYGSFDTLKVELVKRVIPSSTVATTNSGASPSTPTLLCFSTQAAGKSQLIAHNELADLHVVFVRSPYFGTSALFSSKNLQIQNPIESFCLGVALGVTRVLKVNASQPVDVCPIDVALNAGLAALFFHHKGKLPANLANDKHVLLDVVGPPTTALVWGMVGEYILDYYGRHSDVIHREVPSGLFDYYPSVLFRANLPDLWNYGLSLSAPAKTIKNVRSNRIRSHLKKFPHATTMERMKNVLAQVDTTLDGLPLFAPAGAIYHGYNNKPYQHTLRLLSQDLNLVDLLFCIDLTRVQWEVQVKRLAVEVLHHLTERILNHTGVPIQLPEPVPYYNNSFVFKGEGRQPEFGFRMRRIFPNIYGTMRSGQQPNGGRTILKPGSTTQRRVGIVAQPHIQLLISKLAREQHVSKEVLERRAHSILLHVGDNLNHQTARFFCYGLRNILSTLYTRINLGSGNQTYDRLFKAFNRPRCAVFLAPTHRSYVDFLVMSYTLMEFGLRIPHICAGEDFLKLGKASDMMRGAGAFFMRRSFKNDKLYGALFKEYVRHLTRDGECIEAFTEGTRSRVQKTMVPKFGFMKMITDAFLERQEEIDDVLIVPVSMSYERILEANVYAKELLGVPKPPETIANLLKSVSILKDDYGALNVVAGEPISVAAFAAQPVQAPAPYEARKKGPDTAPVISSKSSGGGDSATPAYLLNALGWRLHDELQKNLVVTPTALLAAALLSLHERSALMGDGIPKALVASNVEFVRAKVLHRGLMTECFGSWDGARLMSYASDHMPGHVIINAKNHVLVNQESVASQMLLQMYTNQLIHLFYDEGCVCVSALSSSGRKTAEDRAHLSHVPGAGERTDETDGDAPPSEGVKLVEEPDAVATVALAQEELAERCRFFKDLLCMEFCNFTRASPICDASWMEVTLDSLEKEGGSKNPVVVRGSDSVIVRQTHFTTFVCQLMYPSVDSYYVTLLTFVTLLNQGQVVAEDILADVTHESCLVLARVGLLDYVSASSKEALKNAFTRFKQLGVVAMETSPGIGLRLKPHFAKNSAANLSKLLAQVNELRWHPTELPSAESSSSSNATYARSLQVVKDCLSQLLNKRATKKKKSKI